MGSQCNNIQIATKTYLQGPYMIQSSTKGPQEILKKISASFSGFAKKIQPGLEKWFSYKKKRVLVHNLASFEHLRR